MFGYQQMHSNFLAEPKRKTPKFIRNTMALNASTQRRMTFSDKNMAIVLQTSKQ